MRRRPDSVSGLALWVQLHTRRCRTCLHNWRNCETLAARLAAEDFTGNWEATYRSARRDHRKTGGVLRSEEDDDLVSAVEGYGDDVIPRAGGRRGPKPQGSRIDATAQRHFVKITGLSAMRCAPASLAANAPTASIASGSRWPSPPYVRCQRPTR